MKSETKHMQDQERILILQDVNKELKTSRDLLTQTPSSTSSPQSQGEIDQTTNNTDGHNTTINLTEDDNHTHQPHKPPNAESDTSGHDKNKENIQRQEGNNLGMREASNRRKNITCKFHKRGQCKFGEECRYNHPETRMQSPHNTKKAAVHNNNPLVIKHLEPHHQTNKPNTGLNNALSEILENIQAIRSTQESLQNRIAATEDRIEKRHPRDNTTNTQNATKKDEICRRAQQGRCNFGTECWYKHPTPEQPPRHRNEERKPRQHPRDNIISAQSTTKKDELCRRAQQGRCNFGIECWYKHPTPEQPPRHRNEERKPRQHPRDNITSTTKKDELCRRAQQGKCNFGKECWYKHPTSEHPLEHRNEGKIPRQYPRDSTTNTQNSTKKDEMCRRAHHGRCKFGKECWYKHPICENAIKGECRFGAKCWHEHPTSASKQAQPANQTHQPNTLDTKNPEQRNKASDDETHFLYLALQKLIDRR